jgi:8-oxo-dGTP pyrophosphatase MutT (NUDIX family)
MAATIMVVRETPTLEVLMVRRHHEIDFVPGAMVFPGGKIAAQDHDPGWAECAIGWEELPAVERAPRIAAIREAFEETGLFLGNGGDGLHGPDTAAVRRQIEEGTLSFRDYVVRAGAAIDLTRLTLFSRWLTPSIMPKRFDTFFYLAAAPAQQFARFDGRETVDCEWIAPSEALRLAAAGERNMVVPTRLNLQLLASSDTLAAAVDAASRRSMEVVTPRVEVRDGKRYLVIDSNAGYGEVLELRP